MFWMFFNASTNQLIAPHFLSDIEIVAHRKMLLIVIFNEMLLTSDINFAKTIEESLCLRQCFK